jgi:sulfite exporter TauE/SafE/copper chaperone CopZ
MCNNEYMNKITIDIAGMHCRSCELLTEDELSSVSGVKKVKTNFRKGTAEIFYDGKKPSESAIAQAVQHSGYSIGKGRAPWMTKDTSVWVALLFASSIVFLVWLFVRQAGWTTFSLGAVDASRLPFLFLVGLAAGVSTCASLVGGLVLGLTSRYSFLHPELTFREKLIPQFWFHVGRVGGFFGFGVLLGMIGKWFSGSIVLTAFLTLFAGLVVLILGLQLTGLFPRLTNYTPMLPKSLSRLLGIRNTEEGYSHRGAVVLGMLTFFLPCGFTQAVQLAVIALGQPLLGGLAMAVFALGTTPGLLALGSAGSAIKGRARAFFLPVVAVVLVVFGVWNIMNSLQLFGFNTLSVTSSVVQKSEEKEDGRVYAPIENGVQIIRLTQDGSGYHPSVLPTLHVSVPARMIIDSKESYTCASSLVIPEFGIRRQLQHGENVIDFTPKKDGTLPFSCSMGMYRGVINVVD